MGTFQMATRSDGDGNAAVIGRVLRPYQFADTVGRMVGAFGANMTL